MKMYYVVSRIESISRWSTVCLHYIFHFWRF